MTTTETVTVQLSANADEWMRLAVEALNPDEPEAGPETLRCESCKATDAVVDFAAFEAGETWGDPICDECLPEHAAQAAEDESNRRAYLYC